MPQGVRIVFHGGNATPVPALQKAGSQLIALSGCRSTDQYCQHWPSQRAGKGRRAEQGNAESPFCSGDMHVSFLWRLFGDLRARRLRAHRDSDGLFYLQLSHSVKVERGEA